jgi:hypothetical protein
MSGRTIRFPAIEFPGIEIAGAEAVPLALIARAEADRRTASEVALHAPQPDPWPNPQPDVDRATLERLYRWLDPDR